MGWAAAFDAQTLHHLKTIKLTCNEPVDGALKEITHLLGRLAKQSSQEATTFSFGFIGGCEKTTVRMTPSSEPLTLEQWLQTIVDGASSPVRYHLESGVIIFKPVSGKVRGPAHLPLPRWARDRSHNHLKDVLQSIQIEELVLDDVPLDEALRILSEQAAPQSPKGSSINFLILSSTATRSEPVSAGSPRQLTTPPAAVHLESVLVNVRPGLRNVTLSQALNAIADGAEIPLSWAPGSTGVHVRARESKLRTTILKTDPNTFQQGLENVQAIPFP